jgi:hypothetical protein
MSDYGTIAPLCDVKGCGGDQTGEEVELALAVGLCVRTRPCAVHRNLLVATGRLVDELQRAWHAIDVFWAEAGAYTVELLKAENPEVIALAIEIHERLHHSESV